MMSVWVPDGTHGDLERVEIGPCREVQKTMGEHFI